MMKRYAAGVCAAMALGMVSAQAHAGPTANEILKKAQDLVANAKTYQATFLVNVNSGQMGTMNSRADIKTAGKKTAVTNTVIGQPTGMMAMAGSQGNSQMVDDGTTTWVYIPSQKKYMKMPSRGQANPMDLRTMLSSVKDSTAKLVGTKSVGGKPAYVVELAPKTAPRGMNQKMTIFIDQANYHVKQMKISMSGAGGQGQPQQSMTVDIRVQNEKMNEPIPDGVFKFTPPAGATEMQGGGMMGGMGGGGARPPR